MHSRSIAYWVLTGLFCAVLGFSGLAHFSHFGAIVEVMSHLGYPVYMMTMLGVAKLLGVGALLAPGRPLLKEWAYAGFTFNLLGATASHVFAGDAMSETIRPALLLLVGAGSYLLRPAARRLPSAPSLGEAAMVQPPTGAASHG
jgi:hypothetical protein